MNSWRKSVILNKNANIQEEKSQHCILKKKIYKTPYIIPFGSVF